MNKILKRCKDNFNNLSLSKKVELKKLQKINRNSINSQSIIFKK